MLLVSVVHVSRGANVAPVIGYVSDGIDVDGMAFTPVNIVWRWGAKQQIVVNIIVASDLQCMCMSKGDNCES